MTLQRKRPAPRWPILVDVFGANRTSMAKWFKVFGPMGVTVRANESWTGATPGRQSRLVYVRVHPQVRPPGGLGRRYVRLPTLLTRA